MALTILPRSSSLPLAHSAARWSAPAHIAVALVNNMPDPALDATAAQFSRLLRAAAGPLLVLLSFCYLPAVPRSAAARDHVRRAYWHIDEVLDAAFDAVIVTGTEPIAAQLADEPYWRRLEQLLEWAEMHTLSSVWSCLAAHAAVQKLDAIARRRLEQKCFGVFRHDVLPAHDLVHGLGASLPMPHSRWNELPAAALHSADYTILTSSPETGADLFIKERRSLFVFFQGHPEYERTTLLKEYRRDVGRFLRGERPNYPEPPCGYFQREASSLLEQFRERALADRSAELLSSFPIDALSSGLQDTWEAGAVGIYRNWLSFVAATKRRGSAATLARGMMPPP